MEIVIFVSLTCFVHKYMAMMLKKECERDEVHKSCSYYEEYTCWETSSLMKRVGTSPKRLAHCRTGCYCKKGMVRAYPQGKCIMAVACRDLELRAILKKIPAEFSHS